MTETQSPEPTQITHTVPSDDRSARWREVGKQITQGNALVSVIAVLLAILVGSIMIALTDRDVQTASGYFFSRPWDTFRALGDAIGGAYTALFRGAIFNSNASTVAGMFLPLAETLKYATPLIAAGLGVGLAFRAGLFNIGGQGQMLMAAAAAGWIGGSFDMPFPVHLIVATLAGLLAGALWGSIAGILKAATGAHEVIVTIMLNNIAFLLLGWMIATQGVLQAPGSSNPKSAPMAESAILPRLLGNATTLHAGLILSLIAVAFTWWLLERSALGFRFRAVGENPAAAKVAGINVGRTYVTVMVIAGGLVALAGVSQTLGTVTSGVDSHIDAGVGFDAITVALLGRSSPIGILGAGILFGAFKAGGYSMQAAEQIPVEIVLVVQSLIVLFLAAPPLIRAVFFGETRTRELKRRQRAAAKGVTV